LNTDREEILRWFEKSLTADERDRYTFIYAKHDELKAIAYHNASGNLQELSLFYCLASLLSLNLMRVC
jgi:hypothetical protein